MKKRIAILLAVLSILLFSTVAFADFGDYAGDSDWGYSDFDYDYDYDYDYGDSYFFFDGGGNGDVGFIDIAITVIVIIVVVRAIVNKNSKNRGNSSHRRTVNIPSQKPEVLVNDISELKSRDPNFNESKFLGDAANLYVRMQDAWSNKDLSPVRSRFTEEFYAKTERQVQSYINHNQTNHVERVSVLSTKIVGCTCDSKNDIITVELLARIVDYTTDDRTGNIIRGDRNRELFMTYRQTFIRTKGKLTSDEKVVDDKHCPSCGAPIDLNRSAVCEYCGSVCTSCDYDWVISDIRGISQRS